MEPTSPRQVGGRYDLVRRIARGGGGTVWEARDGMLGRTVAVKAVEIPDEVSEGERDRLRARVLSEARAAARLDHPGVVVIHDVIDGDAVVHLVMEYVEAPTLREVVDQRGPLPETAAAAIGYGLLDVLEEAHRRGVVHRDVKPSNVFVLDDGTVKLADYGIAALTGEVSLTRTGVALGSPSYLAPEQARGESAAPPADLWGLGATLYFAVEGVPPFDRRTALATVHAVVNDPVRPYERADALRAPITALLAKEPAGRPDMAGIRGQLAAVAGIPLLRDVADHAAATAETSAPATEPLAAAPAEPAPEPGATAAPPATTPTAHGGGGRRRSRAAVGLVAIVAVAALVLVAMATMRDTEAPPLAGDEEPGEDPVEAGPDDEEGAQDATQSDAAEDDPEAADEETDDPQDGQAGQDAANEAATDGRYVVPETDAPEDFQIVGGPTYELAVPAGWQERAADGNRTDWVEPETGAYLRVDWTDDPADDPVADWEQAEPGFAQRQSDYERVRLEPAVYRTWDAAMWEYTYTAGGANLRAINLNVLADDLGHAYALNLQAPVGEWDRVAGYFPAITGSFQPTVGG